MTDTTEKPFTVQAGKRYVRRDGEISGVIETNCDRYKNTHIFKDPDGSKSYTEFGRWSPDDSKDVRDLISEYIEQEPTAAPVTDEWWPWIGWNGGECPVDEDVVVEVVYYVEDLESDQGTAVDVSWNSFDLPIIAYRIKKEPEVRENSVWLRNGEIFDFDVMESRKAIITTQGDNISIRWADKGEPK